MLLAGEAFAVRSFTDPLFESFDAAAMRAARQAQEAEPATPERDLDLGLLGLFLAEEADVRAAVHEANALRDDVEVRCNDWRRDHFQRLPDGQRARAAGLCVIVWAEAFERAAVWGRIPRAARLRDALFVLQTEKLDAHERLYLEGRIFAILPTDMGLDFRRAILALATLQRLQPALSSADYWLGRTYLWQRNSDAAREQFRKAVGRSPSDPRTLRLLVDTDTRIRRRWLDGWESGLEPSLFLSPQRGFGASLRYVDERLGDRDQDLDASIWVSTRGSFGLNGTLEEGTWLAPTRLGFAAYLADGPEDFFGLGSSSRSEDQTRLSGFRADVRASITQPFLKAAALTVGWRAISFYPRHLQSVNGAPVIVPPDIDGRVFTGPFVRLELDTRDSHFDPRQGTYLGITGFFPTTDLGSPRSFTGWETWLRQYIPFGWRQHLQLGVVALGVAGDAPFAAYPKLPPLSGIREFRFQDRNAIVANVELARRIFGPFTVFAFFAAGTVVPNTVDLFHSPWRWGGGGGVSMILARAGRTRLRLEIGRFAGDTIVRAQSGFFF